MREYCTSGSVRGAPGNRRPYRGEAGFDLEEYVIQVLEGKVGVLTGRRLLTLAHSLHSFLLLYPRQL
jgi:hypothetical protein